ncbi:phosphoribosyl transferase domain protein [Daldinia sp. FL1419]|nr:phosphoribosyl transferase domain protein [Daldinia sp. FL1419]
MANIETLKKALRQSVTEITSSTTQRLSDAQYSAAFDILMQGSRWTTYQEFIIPQLSRLLRPLFDLRAHISVLEIGPGPKSVLGYLPCQLRRKIRRYDAFEPNNLSGRKLKEWISTTTDAEQPFPSLEDLPHIHETPFSLDSQTVPCTEAGTKGNIKYDIIIFCHSMYGMRPHHKFIKKALGMLIERSGGMLIVFHHDQSLDLADLACHRIAHYPSGVITVPNKDEVIDHFAAFVAGFVAQNADIRAKWRKLCRTLGHQEETSGDRLAFNSPNVMVAFTRHATALAELTAHVPAGKRDTMVKNREANFHHPTSIIRPTNIQHVQHCVKWALKNGVSLTVLGGGHSGHCLWPSVVSVDMGAFDGVHVIADKEAKKYTSSGLGHVVVAEAGCKTGDIIQKAMAAGFTVPLGARPSVGAGLWLQGGIGHLSRRYGLACDAIIGAVMVSIKSGQVLCIGYVPNQVRPTGAVRPGNEADLLWAIKGAGTNFGIVISVTFTPYTDPMYLTKTWIFPLKESLQTQHTLNDYNRIAAKLPRNCSADAFLYWDARRLHLGITLFESSTSTNDLDTRSPAIETIDEIFGAGEECKAANGVDLFDMEMYMSKMHYGHGRGKTSSFKRCLFLKDIGAADVVDTLTTAITKRPEPLCYVHLLQGGGAVSDIAGDATAFGCRDWNFACIVTGVWPRYQDNTETHQAVVQWVYSVVGDLMPFSTGAYGADLGPDPRDAALAAKAFGPNQLRLARLKQSLDPCNVLAHACPLPKAPREPPLIVIVTGESCAGKDYCASVWVSTLSGAGLTACVVSISDVTKREYVVASGADLERLLVDRAYKEQHRPALTEFWKTQVRQRPRLPEEHFLSVVQDAEDVDMLIITGMREEAPVATLSYLVPGSKLLEVHVQASDETRLARGASQGRGDNNGDSKLNHRPNFVFNNNKIGTEIIKQFAECSLLQFFHQDLHRLADMVRLIPDFPRQGIEFRHVLDISQQPGGLTLCVSLLQTHFVGNWTHISTIVSCEAGGFIFASALAAQVNSPLTLIREAGKLPPPTIAVAKSSSHISTSTASSTTEKMIELERDVIPKGASVVVVDDVLATGETLLAILRLLDKAGISAEDISVMVVAEFPKHRGREKLRQHGFGKVNIQNLLVYDGM